MKIEDLKKIYYTRIGNDVCQIKFTGMTLSTHTGSYYYNCKDISVIIAKHGRFTQEELNNYLISLEITELKLYLNPEDITNSNKICELSYTSAIYPNMIVGIDDIEEELTEHVDTFTKYDISNCKLYLWMLDSTQTARRNKYRFEYDVFTHTLYSACTKEPFDTAICFATQEECEKSRCVKVYTLDGNEYVLRGNETLSEEIKERNKAYAEYKVIKAQYEEISAKFEAIKKIVNE